MADTVSESLPVQPATAHGPVTPLRFLIVDDERTNRVLLREILEQDGHRVSEADNGGNAVRLFENEQPDMVLMDIRMPVMDGYTATREIKQLSGSRFVPVIFLTALTDDTALARCIEAGGDDFLVKPYNQVILQSKIRALLRLRDLYRERENQRDQIQLHHQRLQQEQGIAERIFSKVVHRGCLDSPEIRYLLSPAALFNGDLLLAARRPSGGLLVLLGDFAGHGLPAAVGALPTAEIFYVMTEKGYSIGDIVSEINQKLKTTLPPELFFAACLLELDTAGQSLAVWNGGIPDVLIRDARGRTLRRLPSRHLPLGVVDNRTLDRHVELVRLSAGERVYAYSDGLTEALNEQGEMFGDTRLSDCLTTVSDQPFERLRHELEAFRATREQRDDITLIELTAMVVDPSEVSAPQKPVAPTHRPTHWRVNLHLDIDTLRQSDPLPSVLQLVNELQFLNEYRERIYLIVAELFNNALEHGLLRLDSARKVSAQGFAEYYSQRRQVLAALTEGWVEIDLVHVPRPGGGCLTIQMRDSGPGFTAQPVPDPAGNLTASTRGLALLHSLCSRVVIHPPGNHVEVDYVWP